MSKSLKYKTNMVIGLGILVLLLSLLFSISARADLVWFYADDDGPLTRSEAPEPTEGEVKFIPSSGNAHAVNHPKFANSKGYDYCMTCHTEDGSAVVKDIDKFL